MKRIESFSINHLKLAPGIYVSRKDDFFNNTITTYDIRITRPNLEPVMNTATIHAIEHIGATYLRNNDLIKDSVIYFGPMGCRTGFYLILMGDNEMDFIVEILKDVFEYICNFNGDIPGATAKECGNYQDMNLSMAKYYSKKYLDEVLKDIKKNQMKYPK
ncbi:MAG: S-ribosylhomocysteine lyase [Bacillota bacterium]|nr:S-ribosylhomocysteine lyase [Bacillota bacterium]